MAPERPPRRWHLALAALGWTIFAVYGSLVPLRYTPVEWADAVERFRNLPPLWFGMGTRADWVANILLFIPLTFLWMGALAADRGRLARLTFATVLIPAASAAAIALEFTQIWFHGRTVSRNDIVAETIGGLVGVVVWMVAGQRALTFVRAYAPGGRSSRFTWLLSAYLIGLLIYSVIPLDLTVSVTELYHKYQRGQVLVVPFQYGYDSLATMVYQFFADIIEFVPVGVWAAWTQRHRWPRASPVVLGMVLGGLVAAAIEFAQLLVLSRYTDVTDVVLGTIGCGLGGWLVSRYGGAAQRAEGTPASATTRWVKTLLAISAYSVFLAIGFWYPFDITSDRTIIAERLYGFFRLPLVSLYLGNEFNAITQVLIRALLFAPVGAMWGYLAAEARSHTGRWMTLLAGGSYALVLATGIEAAQILMPAKIADATEVGICAAGALGAMAAAMSLLRVR